MFLKMSQNSQEHTCARLSFLMKLQAEALAQLFSFEFCEVSKNNFFTEHLRATASDHSLHSHTLKDLGVYHMSKHEWKVIFKPNYIFSDNKEFKNKIQQRVWNTFRVMKWIYVLRSSWIFSFMFQKTMQESKKLLKKEETFNNKPWIDN